MFFNNSNLLDFKALTYGFRSWKAKQQDLVGSTQIFFSEPPVSQTEKNIFLMYSQGLKFTIAFLSSG